MPERRGRRVPEVEEYLGPVEPEETQEERLDEYIGDAPLRTLVEAWEGVKPFVPVPTEPGHLIPGYEAVAELGGAVKDAIGEQLRGEAGVQGALKEAQERAEGMAVPLAGGGAAAVMASRIPAAADASPEMMQRLNSARTQNRIATTSSRLLRDGTASNMDEAVAMAREAELNALKAGGSMRAQAQRGWVETEMGAGIAPPAGRTMPLPSEPIPIGATEQIPGRQALQQQAYAVKRGGVAPSMAGSLKIEPEIMGREKAIRGMGFSLDDVAKEAKAIYWEQGGTPAEAVDDAVNALAGGQAERGAARAWRTNRGRWVSEAGDWYPVAESPLTGQRPPGASRGIGRTTRVMSPEGTLPPVDVTDMPGRPGPRPSARPSTLGPLAAATAAFVPGAAFAAGYERSQQLGPQLEHLSSKMARRPLMVADVNRETID
ncbi:MAG: hypothetical protein ABIL09_08890, partial [Gemmatimonadota bacterium]